MEQSCLVLKGLFRHQISKHQFFFLEFQIKIFKRIGVVLKYLPREMLYTSQNSHFTIKIRFFFSTQVGRVDSKQNHALIQTNKSTLR